MNSSFYSMTVAMLAGMAIAPLESAMAQKTSPAKAPYESIKLEEVASFPKQQVTGVTVSSQGRIFVSFPNWSDDHTLSVAEIIDGQPKPYPDEAWNLKDGAPDKRWVCVQSVVADDAGSLWVVDAASPKMGGVIPGGAKLVKINLATNHVSQVFAFDDKIAPTKSYLNDVRVNTNSGHAYLTESGMGALIVVDLVSGKARRVLANHASTHAEPGVTLTVEGTKLIDSTTGKAPVIHADGIALDNRSGWLYYHALCGDALYRIPTAALRDESLSDKALMAKIEKVGITPKPDGMLEGRDDTVYLTDFENNAIVRFEVKKRKSTVVAKDDRLQWPDTLSWGADGKLYVTTSQIHRMPKYHDDESKQKGSFMVYRMKLP